MFPNKILVGICGLMKVGMGAAPPPTQAPNLQAILRRERSRANRTGSRLSMLMFTPAGKAPDHDVGRRVLRFLRQRSRCTDELGKGRDNSVWFVMPDCSATSARKAGDEIRRELAADGLPLHCEVYHYDSASPTARRWSDVHQRDSAVDRGSPPPRQQTPPAKQTSLAEQPGGDVTLFARPMEEMSTGRPPWWKRFLDLLGAAIGLALLGPLLLLVALLIKVFSSGPVLFVQHRSGRGGKPFRIYKFRTMVDGAQDMKRQLASLNERDGPAFKMKRDPRVTRFGRILRATNLDELPQLWNVLRGEMSLVGPRPLPCDETAACEAWQVARVDGNPGLTCSWQASRRRSEIPFAEWMRMDIRYIRSMSPILDLKLILRTLVNIVLPRGGE